MFCLSLCTNAVHRTLLKPAPPPDSTIKNKSSALRRRRRRSWVTLRQHHTTIYPPPSFPEKKPEMNSKSGRIVGSRGIPSCDSAGCATLPRTHGNGHWAHQEYSLNPLAAKAREGEGVDTRIVAHRHLWLPLHDPVSPRELRRRS